MQDHTLAPTADLSPYGKAEALVAAGAGFDGTLYFVFARQALDTLELLPGGAGIPKTKPAKPQSYRVVGLRDGEPVVDVVIEDEQFNIHHVQPLPDGLLLACARCRRRSADDIDRNGRIYDWTGKLIDSVVLGDGIDDLQTTSTGRICASYFDEGIIGNFGWDAPLGSSGLVQWDLTGNKIWEFAPSDQLDDICDCYALNVASNADVWCCYYTEFPMVHLRDGQIVDNWAAPVRGSSAFAISHRWLLMRGGYKERDTYVLTSRRQSGREPIRKTFRWLDESGREICAERAIGRGPVLSLLWNNKLYQVDVGSLARFVLD